MNKIIFIILGAGLVIFTSCSSSEEELELKEDNPAKFTPFGIYEVIARTAFSTGWGEFDFNIPEWKKLSHQEVLFRGFCCTPYFSDNTESRAFQKEFYFPVANESWIMNINDPLGWLSIMDQLKDSGYRLRLIGSGETMLEGFEQPQKVSLIFLEVKNHFFDEKGAAQHNWITIDSLHLFESYQMEPNKKGYRKLVSKFKTYMEKKHNSANSKYKHTPPSARKKQRYQN